MLVLLTAALMLIVAYSFFREGVLTALTMLVNVFVAGLVAFNFFELLADELSQTLSGTFLEGCEDALCLFGIFALTLGLLRVITNNLANQEVELPPIAQQAGAVCVALLTGYLLAGFLLCLVQTLPLSERFMGFDWQADAGAPKLRRILPPDRVWLALMGRASAGPLSQADSTTFDPDATFEMRYARRRAKESGERKE